MLKSALIIADIHLFVDDIKKNQLLEKLCKQAENVNQLFILGDLFNTWIGDDLSLSYYAQTISLLKNLSAKTEILVMAGNRDFLLGKEFTQQTNCKIINSPYLLTINKHQYVLTHGDELCTDDKSYQRLKLILQNPIAKAIFIRLSKKLRLKISNKLRKNSIKSQQYKSAKITDVNLQAVNKLMQKYPRANLIHGHTHRRNTHIEKNFIRYVLGDWSATQGSGIEITNKLNWFEIR
jgi:UDP-2,3-diacylglucosamine hydrolase